MESGTYNKNEDEGQYIELHLHSNYSFQEGASSIEELISQAVKLGYRGLAITDHDNLCGAMEFAQTCREFNIQPIIGCEVTMTENHHLTLLAETRQGYTNLSWLISQAHSSGRHNPALDISTLTGHTDGLIALSGCQRGEIPSLLKAGKIAQAEALAYRYRELFGVENYFLELQHNFVRGDFSRNQVLVTLAEKIGVGVVATCNVHYHIRDRHKLQDCLIAIKENTSLEACHSTRRPNDQFFLKSPKEVASLFRWHPAAIRNAAHIANRCAKFDLSQDLGYTFPSYPTPKGYTTQSYLQQLCREAAIRRYGEISWAIHNRLKEEFNLIETHNLAGFFLIYHEVIQIAHEIAVDLNIASAEVPLEVNPPGRSRGSSVSMLVGYLLGLSHVDPIKYNLSLERFLPDDELANVPDIDLDFSRNIREELILRVHEKYGRDRAALVGMITTYRLRSAIRNLGKALALPHELINKLGKRVDEQDNLTLRQIMLNLPEFCDKVDAPIWRELTELTQALYGFPKGLAQHPGGMVIGSSSLIEIVPVQPSAIEGRFILQWDKESIGYAGLAKIDFLSIGALSQIQETIRCIAKRRGKIIDLSRINFDDQSVYEMIHGADTIGVFQIESAAQMQTVTRLKPRNLTDMAHEVAAVRPGVGANNGVRHYLLRRAGLEKVTYLHEELEKPILAKSLGIILFQDQVNQLAMRIGGLGAADADRLRRAFTRPNNILRIAHWQQKFVEGALSKGVTQSTALKIFSKFNGNYMFPEAHAFAFGITAYQVAWLKYYYTLEFFLGLFNQQPMGFYSPETLKEDAKRHGVGVLNPNINRSADVCTYEANTIRLGLRYVSGIGKIAVQRILMARNQNPFQNLADFVKRTGLRQHEIEDLVNAGALDSFGDNRRELRWEVGLRHTVKENQLPLDLSVQQDMASLATLNEFDKMVLEYRTLGMHPQSHAMAHVRSHLDKRVLTSDNILNLPSGTSVLVAGLVIRRQRPSAKALFITLEDENGHIPLVVWPRTYAKFRDILNSAFLLVQGVVSRRDNTFNIVVEHVKALPIIPYSPKSYDFR